MLYYKKESQTPMTSALHQGEGIPNYDEITPEVVNEFFPGILPQLNTDLDALELEFKTRLESGEPFTWELLGDRLDDLYSPLGWAWGAVSHLISVRNTPELREARLAQLPAIMEFGNRIGQSRIIYDAMVALRGTRLDDIQQRILDAEIEGMVSSGVNLDGDVKEAFNADNQRLAELSSEFSNNVLTATQEWARVFTDVNDLRGVPQRVLDTILQEDGTWKVTLDIPTYSPVMTYAEDRDLRQLLYIAQVSRAGVANEEVISEILTLRSVQASRRGYNNWAEVSLSTKMASDVNEIEGLLESLNVAATPIAERELAELQEFADTFGAPKLEQWDMSFWAQKLRKSKFDLDSEALRPYFPLPQVLDGLFGLCNRLFGITVRAADGEVHVWNDDVRFFNVYDEDDNFISSFFLDPYSRPSNKRGGAWMNGCIDRCLQEDGSYSLPVAYLICNQTPPTDSAPSLMSFGEVETLFHEFGHGLQHMLTTVPHAGAAGINLVEWDAVELPSQFMENWCLDRSTLFGMAGHYETGAPLPEAEYDKLCAAKTFMTGNGTLRQNYLALTDLRLHYKWDPESGVTPDALRREVASEILLTNPIEEDAALCSFGHIFSGGYSAGYYSYKWAEVLSADAFAAFEEVGLDNEEAIRETGRRFRDTVLSMGGSKSPAEVFAAFRGRTVTTDALIRHSGLG